MILTQDWFSHAIPTWQQYVVPYLKERFTYLSVLELGCFEGRASIWMMENLLNTVASRLTVVDTFEGSDDQAALGLKNFKNIFQENIKPWKDRVRIYDGHTHRLFPLIAPNESAFQFIYVDASHNAWDVFTDATMYSLLLDIDGLLCFDDYEWPGISQDPLTKPKCGIDEFIYRNKDRFEIVYKGYQVILKKLKR